MFGDSLKAIRKEKKISQKALSEALFVSQQSVAKWETNKASPNPETIVKIAAALGVPLHVLLESDAPSASNIPAPSMPGSRWVPVLGKVAAGVPIEAIEEVLDYEEVSAEMARTGEYYGLQIKGDSMEPRMKSGDVVIVRQQETAETGDIAVVLVNGDEATVKRVRIQESGIALIPSNPAYNIMFYTNEEIDTLPVRIIGKVVELRAKF